MSSACMLVRKFVTSYIRSSHAGDFERIEQAVTYSLGVIFVLKNVSASASRAKMTTEIVVGEPGGHPCNPLTPQEPSTMVPKCTLGCPNTISLVSRTAIGMHRSYSPLRKGTLLCSPGH